MTTQQQQSFNPMEGFMLVDDIFNLRNPAQLPHFLLGEYDNILKSAFFFKENFRKPNSIEELNACVPAQTALDNLKKIVRGHLQMAATQAARQEERAEKQRQYQAKKDAESNFKAQHQASELGTVSEIAEKYGISKKKVRELKRDGKLEDYIQNL